jgi:hypothetical protein
MTDEKIENSTIAKILGSKGGKSKSKKKITASKKNGKKGGRPKMVAPIVEKDGETNI